MSSAEPTEWELLRIGSAAVSIREAVVASVYAAQERAVGAHNGGGGRSHHAYGHQLSAAQFEELADHTRNLDGVVLRKPEKSAAHYELPLVLETSTIIFPLRYAKDGRTARNGAKISDSKVRRDLLHAPLIAELGRQGDLFEPTLTEAELAERDAADRELRAELAKSGRVITVGFACSPDGIFDLGWGDAVIDENSGRISWTKWESLKNVSAMAAGRHLRSVDLTATTGPRFDEEADDVGFSLTPNVETGAVNSEKTPEVDVTGSENSE